MIRLSPKWPFVSCEMWNLNSVSESVVWKACLQNDLLCFDSVIYSLDLWSISDARFGVIFVQKLWHVVLVIDVCVTFSMFLFLVFLALQCFVCVVCVCVCVYSCCVSWHNNNNNKWNSDVNLCSLCRNNIAWTSWLFWWVYWVIELRWFYGPHNPKWIILETFCWIAWFMLLLCSNVRLLCAVSIICSLQELVSSNRKLASDLLAFVARHQVVTCRSSVSSSCVLL